jgi:hypothetical protein
VAVVVTSVAAAEALAGALRLAGAAFPPATVVVPTATGAVVAAAVDTVQAQDLAGSVSRVLRDVPVVLLSQEAGQIGAGRWVGGRVGESLAPGLVLTSLDDTVEALLLGRTLPSAAVGAIEVARLGRLHAARMVAAARRAR